ncbi:glycosyl transferase family 2 [Dyadobacter jejuensis]|uniref:Glycosyl transferase family 2 n=1 Tax=Dyadobacter jejuensis TaxID=1082580 RepID=A0A316ASE7_9BACT|nr:glycosyltransferase [Dyadobacter jejuensis]PWJ60623.1 glycosyl transferase family 2 [Dyadobacter jejuensis]
MKQPLAPIILFCYNRPWHLQQTITSLLQCDWAAESSLTIYSDGPKTAADRHLVTQVRDYLKEVKGFGSIHIIASEQNKGLAYSVIQGVSEGLLAHGKIIVLEDDMICAKDFLVFMNQALETFKTRAEVFSVTGYAPPVAIPDGYPFDLYMAPRASSWGWGTWNDRWQKADWQVKDFEDSKLRKELKRKMVQGGDDLWPMLVKQQKGLIDSWAVRWTWTQAKHHAYGVYPVRSKIKNIGTDGSGTNFKTTNHYFDNTLSASPLQINGDIEPTPSVLEAFRAYYKLPLLLKIKNLIRYKIF